MCTESMKIYISGTQNPSFAVLHKQVCCFQFSSLHIFWLQHIYRKLMWYVFIFISMESVLKISSPHNKKLDQIFIWKCWIHFKQTKLWMTLLTHTCPVNSQYYNWNYVRMQLARLVSGHSPSLVLVTPYYKNQIPFSLQMKWWDAERLIWWHLWWTAVIRSANYRTLQVEITFLYLQQIKDHYVEAVLTDSSHVYKISVTKN